MVDKSRTMPEIRQSDGELSTSGRGLVLINALTNRWGTDLFRWGKRVWGKLESEPAK
ncbi:hypothetical protein ACWD4O_29645 [Streptomyces sp. NPDC002623]